MSKQKNNTSVCRMLAHYLPQFYPIQENDEFWGAGFTEWTNVAKARPLFPGHIQPNIPADLGFYDLRVPETRIAQAQLAKKYGIEGFIYWHYWFSGKLVLEKPLEEVLSTGKPDFPFCFAWANHDWTKEWLGAPDEVLIKQQYPGFEDHRKHFYYWLPFMQDKRYFRVNGYPLLLILIPKNIPDIKKVTDYWRQLANKEGLDDLYLVGYAWHDPIGNFQPKKYGFDATTFGHQSTIKMYQEKTNAKRYEQLGWPAHLYHYKNALPYLLHKSEPKNNIPTVVPNWDNSPRWRERALILHDSTPELFKGHLLEAVNRIKNKPIEEKIIFLKSWNEWAEGNYVEPDIRYGHNYLEVIRNVLMRGKV